MSYSVSSILEPVVDAEILQVAVRLQAKPAAIRTTRGAFDTRAEDIAVISHEMRNSLAVVRNAARLLRAPASAEHVEAARVLIERHSIQMSRHIEELLHSTDSHGLDPVLQLARIDLRVIARHAADAIAPEMARRGHHLVVRLPPTPVWADADGARIEQVLANLLINAAKYTPNGGDIALTMERDQRQAYIRVRDSGVGIEAAMLSRVFGMFVQVIPTLPRLRDGSGIGLAVVRNLVELHGGFVKAASPGLGFGSEFTVILPTTGAQA